MRGIALRAVYLAVVIAAMACARGEAAVVASQVGGSFGSPVLVTAPPGDAHRQFVLEENGVISVLVDGVRQSQPFLTVPHGAHEGQNVLSLAFAPDYATSGLFYVYEQRWDNTSSGVQNVEGRVQEFSRSATNPNLADPASQRTVLTTDVMPRSLHVGGDLGFGPDGMLYVSVGDGDAQGNPDNSAQLLTSLLGKLLRLDPRATSTAPYTVPADNPYPTATPPYNLVYARGLRNPWRFSFGDGGIFIGDPGESRLDEIDWVPQQSLAATNFGWNCFEGTLVYDAGNSCPGARPPVLDYPPSGPSGCGSAVIGGLVVQDSNLTDLYRRYLYGDYCTGQLRSFSLVKGVATNDRPVGLTVPGLTSIREDGQHRVFITAEPSSGPGVVYRLSELKTVTTCTEAALKQAVKGGGTVQFGADCDIPFTSTLAVGNVPLDIEANGHSVEFDGGHSVRIMSVAGGQVTLDGLTFANGFVQGAPGAAGVAGSAGKSGAAAEGAALLITSGSVTLNDVNFSSNTIQGGAGGAGASGTSGSGGADGAAGSPGGNGVPGSAGATATGELWAEAPTAPRSTTRAPSPSTAEHSSTAPRWEVRAAGVVTRARRAAATAEAAVTESPAPTARHPRQVGPTALRGTPAPPAAAAQLPARVSSEVRAAPGVPPMAVRSTTPARSLSTAPHRSAAPRAAATAAPEEVAAPAVAVARVAPAAPEEVAGPATTPAIPEAVAPVARAATAVRADKPEAAARAAAVGTAALADSVRAAQSRPPRARPSPALN